MVNFTHAPITGTTMGEILFELNTATNGYLGIAYVLLPFIGIYVIFGLFGKSSEKDNLLISGFITMLNIVYLSGMGILTEGTVIGYAVIYAVYVGSYFMDQVKS